MAQLILNPTPLRLFEDHKGGPIVINGQNINDKCRTNAIAVSPDGQRMVTASWNIIRLWDMKKGVLLKRLVGHSSSFVNALSVSRDGQLIASGDDKGMLIAWDSNIGESLTQAIKAHSGGISSLAFSPGGSLLATGSEDGMIKLWCTKTWELLGNPITFHQPDVRNRADQGLLITGHFRDVLKPSVRCVWFSPSGELLAIATHSNIQIYDSGRRECVANFEGHIAINKSYNNSLVWMPDGTRLFSAGSSKDPTIREWDTSTWKQVGDPWKGHFKSIRAISLNSNGTLLASASEDNRVRLWRISDRRTIVSFKHPCGVWCIAFSADDRRIVSGDQDKISEWPVFEGALPEDRLKDVPKDGSKDDSKDGSKDDSKERVMHQVTAQAYSDFKVLAMNSDARKACIAGGTRAAKIVLDQEIDTDANNYTSYANRAFVMARKSDWDRALHDAINSVRIQPSFAGHISEGIALFGKKKFGAAASTAFDLASAFTNGDLKTTHFLFLIKTIALFNAGQHKEAMLRVEELAISPNVDTLACRVVEAYLRVHLGNTALNLGNTAFNQKFYDEAVDHFTAAINASAFFYKSAIHSTYEEFVVGGLQGEPRPNLYSGRLRLYLSRTDYDTREDYRLRARTPATALGLLPLSTCRARVPRYNSALICVFLQLFGWDLKSLWQNAHQQQCHALFKAGRIGAAVESYRSTMDKSDEDTKAGLSAWFAALQ